MTGNVPAVEPVDPRHNAPESLAPVQDLVNTWYGHLAGGADDGLATRADLARFCREHGTEVADEDVTDDDVVLAQVVREGVRAALARHDDAGREPVDGEALARLEAVAPDLSLHVGLGGGPASLVALGGGVRALLADVLGRAVTAADDWPRLKVCRHPRCRAAFFDRSRNGSGVWCSMAVCGSDTKKRAFVERRRAGTRAG